jgi:hypothetical protein
VWSLAARAQQTESMRRIGLLMAAAANDPEYQARLAPELFGSATSVRGASTVPPHGQKPLLAAPARDRIGKVPHFLAAQHPDEDT